MECDQMRFIFQNSLHCGLHTSSICVAVFGPTSTVGMTSSYELFSLWTFQFTFVHMYICTCVCVCVCVYVCVYVCGLTYSCYIHQWIKYFDNVGDLLFKYQHVINKEGTPKVMPPIYILSNYNIYWKQRVSL